MFFIQTYSIEDCWKYDSTAYATITSVNIPLPQSNFSIEFITKRTQTNGGGNVSIGADTNNIIGIGVIGSNGVATMYINKNGSRLFTGSTSQITLNTDTTFTYTYVNGVHTLKWDNMTATYTNNTLDVSKIFNIGCSNGYVKDIKIKPL